MAKRTITIIVVIAAVGVLGLVALSSSLFSISAIDIEGLRNLNPSIIADAGIVPGVNIFSVSDSKAVETLLKNPYIAAATVKKQFPDKVVVAVTERKPRAYVWYTERFILVDEAGTVLNIQSNMSDITLPVIVGLSFDSYAVGEPLPVTNPGAFERVVKLANIFDKYGLDDVTKIDAGDMLDVHFYVGTWDVAIGDCSDRADEKVGFFAEARKQGKLPNMRGLLNLKNADKNQFVFTIFQ